MSITRSVGFLLLIGACGKSADGGGADAAVATSVKLVDCASASPAMTVTTVGNAYQPAQVTIPAGGVVKWMLPVQHDVSSAIPGLHVDFGGTACLQFIDARQYAYKCSAHGFTGSVTVQ